jgi:hypothetical protein
MKLRFLFIVISFIIISIFKTNAQQNVAINTTGAAPDASAILDISSTNKGLLIPRVALTQTSLATPITAPATSLLVYNTATVNDVTPGYYFWDGTAWIRMLSGGIISNDWALLGNAGTNPSTNFLGTTDAQDMVIRTNNTEKMRVESGGNVGIGTNNPAYKLHLYGTSNNAADVYSQTDAGRIVKHWFVNANRSWSVGQIGTTQSPNYSFQITDETAGSPRMSITTGGDVGIAETNPVYRLDVRSTFGVALPGVDPNNFIKLNASGASSMAFIAFNDLGRLEFRAQSSSSYSTSGLGASSTIMTIDGTTNHVGIGETSPTQKLTIVENTPFSLGGSDTGVDNIYLENHSMGEGDGNYGGSISFSGPYNGGGGAPRRHAAIVGVQVTTESDYVGLAFFTHNSSVSTGDMQESMRLTHNGNLGIGTTTPSAQLHTTGSVRFQGAGTPAAGRVLTSDANGNATWQDPSGGAGTEWALLGNAGTNPATNFLGTTDAQDLVFRTNNTERWRITTRGQLEPRNSGYSIFIGEFAGDNDDFSSNYNVGIGYEALIANTSGYQNVAIGQRALYRNTIGNENVAIGYWACQGDVNGTKNTGVGKYALYQNQGDNNTGIGYAAGAGAGSPTYTNCTFLGYDSDGSGSMSNAMALGNGATATATNRVRIGNSSITQIGGQVSWSTLSDGRIKENLTEDVVGLDFIMKLRPVTYNFNKDKQEEILNRIDSSEYAEKYEIEKIKFSGFIAQEVEQAALEVGYDFSGVKKPANQNDLYGLSYAEFVVPLVKATQEQQTEIEEIKALHQQEIDALKEQNKALQEQIDELKMLIENK